MPALRPLSQRGSRAATGCSPSFKHLMNDYDAVFTKLLNPRSGSVSNARLQLIFFWGDVGPTAPPASSTVVPDLFWDFHAPLSVCFNSPT